MLPCSTGPYLYRIRPGDSLWLIARQFHTTVQELALANPGLSAYNLIVGQAIHIPDRCNPKPEQPLPTGSGEIERLLSNQMRLLWEQHVYWTRMAILGMAFGTPDAQDSAERLMHNPKDFELLLSTYYGEEIAAKFAELLTSHLKIASELVKAAKEGNTTAIADAEKQWYENADQIADYLSSINPYWSMQEWKKMLYKHLAMTENEAVDILNQKYDDGIGMFDDIELEALVMADMMTRGITRQFPQFFR